MNTVSDRIGCCKSARDEKMAHWISACSDRKEVFRNNESISKQVPNFERENIQALIS
jgi:predicted ribonuclease YlaK